MLDLTKIEEGACYFSNTTNLYVAWSMLCNSSKLFWGCETIKTLDQAKSLWDQAFVPDELGFLPTSYSKLLELLQSMESSVLDAVRIDICFENYFKAKLLLGNYIIHEMEVNTCCRDYPQFTEGKELRQDKTPISINEVRQAEKRKEYSIGYLKTLTERTIGTKTLLQPKYKAVYSSGQLSDDQKLFSLLDRLKNTRNTLHFLNIEYLLLGGTIAIDDFVFLRDYVSEHIDALAYSIQNERDSELKLGEKETDFYLPYSNDGEFDI